MPVWQASDRPVTDQFNYWREVICQAFVPLASTPRAGYADGFRGAVETRQLGFLNPSTLGSEPQEVRHGRAEVRRTTDDCVFVNLQLGGRCGVRQLGQESLIAPGQFTMVDTTEPYAFDLQGQWRIMSFRVPRSTLSSRVADLDRAVARPFDCRVGTGAVVGSVMSALWNVGEVGDGPALLALQDTFVAALTAVLPSRSDDGASNHPARRAAILSFVRSNLADPQLSVTSVARRFAMSPRTLHQVFADHDESFAVTVRNLRLEACARRLADPACTESITAVAAGFGFVDPSSFSRAFRRRYGITPREVRDGHPAP